MTTRQLIEKVAYDLYLKQGSPDGKSDYFWFEAEKMVDRAGYDLNSHELKYKNFLFAPFVPFGNQYEFTNEGIFITTQEEARLERFL